MVQSVCRDLERRLEIVRLGQGVDATGEFHPDALRRTFAAVEEYAELIKKADVPVEKVHFVATSAARDAKNRDRFFAGIKERLGVEPDVISGKSEAQPVLHRSPQPSHPGWRAGSGDGHRRRFDRTDHRQRRR